VEKAIDVFLFCFFSYWVKIFGHYLKKMLFMSASGCVQVVSPPPILPLIDRREDLSLTDDIDSRVSQVCERITLPEIDAGFLLRRTIKAIRSSGKINQPIDGLVDHDKLSRVLRDLIDRMDCFNDLDSYETNFAEIHNLRGDHEQIIMKRLCFNQSMIIQILSDPHSGIEGLLAKFKKWRKKGLLDKNYHVKESIPVHFLFLGDYGDRPHHWIFLYVLLLFVKENFEYVTLLKGNHDNVGYSKAYYQLLLTKSLQRQEKFSCYEELSYYSDPDFSQLLQSFYDRLFLSCLLGFNGKYVLASHGTVDYKFDILEKGIFPHSSISHTEIITHRCFREFKRVLSRMYPIRVSRKTPDFIQAIDSRSISSKVLFDIREKLKKIGFERKYYSDQAIYRLLDAWCLSSANSSYMGIIEEYETESFQRDELFWLWGDLFSDLHSKRLILNNRTGSILGIGNSYRGQTFIADIRLIRLYLRLMSTRDSMSDGVRSSRGIEEQEVIGYITGHTHVPAYEMFEGMRIVVMAEKGCAELIMQESLADWAFFHCDNPGFAGFVPFIE